MTAALREALPYRRDGSRPMARTASRSSSSSATDASILARENAVIARSGTICQRPSTARTGNEHTSPSGTP